MTGHRAVILGGGLAGMLAASVLAAYADEVTVVERDRLSTAPRPRNGIPQAHHGHVLLPAGTRLLERLLPGIVSALLRQGAVCLGLPNDLVFFNGYEWLPRPPERHFALCCGRSMLDWGLRQRVLDNPRITVVEAAEAEELVGTRARVSGVRVWQRRTGESAELPATLVVDATGGGSRASHWLAKLGMSEVRHVCVDPGWTYATRLYLAPDGARGKFPMVSVHTKHDIGHPGRAGVLLPIENGQWMVTLSGTRGAHPPTDVLGFEGFARGLPHGVLADLLETAEPVGGVRGYRGSSNRLRGFVRVPEGFLVIGDALAVTNPTYAQGMSVAARHVETLRAGLAEYGFVATSGPRLQRDVLRGTRAAWRLVATADAVYPRIPVQLCASWRKRVWSRVRRVAAHRPDVHSAVLGCPPSFGRLTELLGPRRFTVAPSGSPPLTPTERAMLHGHDVSSA